VALDAMQRPVVWNRRPGARPYAIAACPGGRTVVHAAPRRHPRGPPGGRLRPGRGGPRL
jgi:hypothetical protein